MTNMKIGIIGGGAMGLLFGAYYGQNHEVTVFTKRKQQAQAIEIQGIRLVCEDNDFTSSVKSQSGIYDLDDKNLVIVAVKQYDIEDLLPILHAIPKKTMLCFVQNGMGHLKWLDALPQTNIFLGTVEHGATRLDDRTVSHNGIGTTNIATFRGERAMETFPEAGHPFFPLRIRNDYREMLHAKLMANALINPLTALFKVKNGKLVSNHYYYQIFQQLYKEISMLFPLQSKTDMLTEIEKICQKTKDNTSSMLKDIEEGRKTEVDAILGYILEEARQKASNCPL